MSDQEDIQEVENLTLEDDTSKAASKKKVKCMCKKKCKGPCKAQKKTGTKAAARAEEEAKKAQMPQFIGRRKAGMDNIRDISIDEFNLVLNGRILLENAELMLNWGNRYGLVGANGCGKTTLLKAISNRDLAVPDNLLIFHLEGEVPASDMTALEAVVSIDAERAWLLEEEKRLMDMETADAKRIANVVERLMEIEADTAEARAAHILDGLGFTAEMQRKKTREFSGGWRMRIALSQALFLQPDVLLLDEPTNHLDLEACIWLENYLRHWERILLIVSHAQDFLNNVCTHTIHMKHESLMYYGGNYDTYVKTREEMERRMLKQYESEQEQIASLKEFISRFGHGSRASQAKSRVKVMNKLVDGGLTRKPTKDRVMRMSFGDPGDIKGAVFTFHNASFAYPGGRQLYKDLDIGLGMDGRVALVGPNGVGKSTLLKLICGEIEPTEGIMRRSPFVRIGRFNQHFIETLDMSKSALDFMLESFPGTGIEEMRGQLGRFGLNGSEHMCKMSQLSGGQKSRVVFSWIARQSPNMLLLDEPTNHLDIETIDALSNAICAFGGAVVVVSHDTRLIQQIAKEIWLVDNQTVTPFPGTIQDYRRKVLMDKGIEPDY